METQHSPTFVTEQRGVWDAWGTGRMALTRIEVGQRVLSAHAFVRVCKDGEEFEAQLSPVDSFGDPGGTHVLVKSGLPEFESDPLDEQAFGEAWGTWLFPHNE